MSQTTIIRTSDCRTLYMAHIMCNLMYRNKYNFKLLYYRIVTLLYGHVVRYIHLYITFIVNIIYCILCYLRKSA